MGSACLRSPASGVVQRQPQLAGEAPVPNNNNNNRARALLPELGEVLREQAASDVLLSEAEANVLRVDENEEDVDVRACASRLGEQRTAECNCGRTINLPEILPRFILDKEHLESYLRRGGDANAIAHYHYFSRNHIHPVERQMGRMTVCQWVASQHVDREVLDLLASNSGSFFAVRTRRGFNAWDIATVYDNQSVLEYLRDLRSLRVVLKTLCSARTILRLGRRSELRRLPVELFRVLGGFLFSDIKGRTVASDPIFQVGYCPLKHRLERRPVQLMGLCRCDVCFGDIPAGVTRLRCVRCDYDQCEKCTGAAVIQQAPAGTEGPDGYFPASLQDLLDDAADVIGDSEEEEDDDEEEPPPQLLLAATPKSL